LRRGVIVDHPPQWPLLVLAAVLVLLLLLLVVVLPLPLPQARALPSIGPRPDTGAQTTDSTPAPDMQRRSTARHSVRSRPWTKSCRSS